MNYFTVIIILYIIFYIVLTIISTTNERKKREKRREVLEKEKLLEKTTPYKEDYRKISKKESEKEPVEIEEVEEIKPSIEISEKKVEEIPQKKIIQKSTEELISPIIKKERIIHTEYEKAQLKLKRSLSFSKNDILKGIIFKEILTPKFRKDKL